MLTRIPSAKLSSPTSWIDQCGTMWSFVWCCSQCTSSSNYSPLTQELLDLYTAKNVALLITKEHSAEFLQHNQTANSSLSHIAIKSNETFGLLTINSSHYEYKQFDYNGELMASVSREKRRVRGYSKEKTIAVVVVVCCLLFLCYFIYSWISCYVKKPRIQEVEEQKEDDFGAGYDMKPVTVDP
eukprot:TRINITY_DN14608_c0_g1_i4.p1 TRINITY_DN14608_c0_g1~~TRINITY_DN14608_c0_g1_i4.p1  ORF type:complete len:184 (-),score=27.91 TRINITY_DN14608_c0_g1_i4:151-702(-)